MICHAKLVVEGTPYRAVRQVFGVRRFEHCLCGWLMCLWCVV